MSSNKEADKELTVEVIDRERKERNITKLKNCYVVKGEVNDIPYKEKFYFDKNDPISIDNAFIKAKIFRDGKVLVNLENDSGYKNIKIIEVKRSDAEDDFCIKIQASSYNIGLNEKVYFGRTRSFKSALKISMNILCEYLNMSTPINIIYDYGLKYAYSLGYEAKDDEPKVVSGKPEIGKTIIDPKTNDACIIKGFYGETYVIAECEVGERTRLINNEVLALNLINDKKEVISDLSKKLDNENLSNEIINELNIKIDTLESDSVEIFRNTIENKKVDSKTFNKLLRNKLTKALNPIELRASYSEQKLLK